MTVQNSTMTVRQVASQAGDANASTRTTGHYPVYVETSTGKPRVVTGARFDGNSVTLLTGDLPGTMTVEQVVRQAGGGSAISTDSHGHVPVTVQTKGGKTRPVVGARFNGSALTLTTGK